jgi:hypothetical protein
MKNAVPEKNFIIPAGYSIDGFWHSICKQGWPDGMQGRFFMTGP